MAWDTWVCLCAAKRSRSSAPWRHGRDPHKLTREDYAVDPAATDCAGYWWIPPAPRSHVSRSSTPPFLWIPKSTSLGCPSSPPTWVTAQVGTGRDTRLRVGIRQPVQPRPASCLQAERAVQLTHFRITPPPGYQSHPLYSYMRGEKCIMPLPMAACDIANVSNVLLLTAPAP